MSQPEVTIEERRTADRPFVSVLVDCPKCFAEPGEPCWAESGVTIEALHHERRTVVYELLARGAAAYA